MKYLAFYICALIVGAGLVPARVPSNPSGQGQALLLHAVRPFARVAPAHKFYASLAQADYNEESKSLEVAIRIFADDLELALTKRAGRAIYLDTTPEVGKLIRAYLQERFEVRDSTGKVAELKWVGMESSVDSMWVYVEAPLAGGVAGAHLRNRILLELYPEQVNTTIIKFAGEKRDFVFKTGDADWKPLSERMKAGG